MGHGLPGEPGADAAGAEWKLAQEAWAKHQEAEGLRHREILRRAKHFDALVEALGELLGFHVAVERREQIPERDAAVAKARAVLDAAKEK